MSKQGVGIGQRTYARLTREDDAATVFGVRRFATLMHEEHLRCDEQLAVGAC